MKATLKYLVILTLVLVVTIFQDLLPTESDFVDFNSNPVFINTFWVLVLPIAMILDSVFDRGTLLSTIQPLLLKRISYIMLASLIHVFLFAFFVQLFSLPIVGQSLHFSTAIAFAISVNLYKYLLIYSIVALVLLKRNK